RQTHHPDPPLLEPLINGGYHAFAEAELAQREAAGFPPFAHLAMLRAEAKHADPPMAFLHAARRALGDWQKQLADVNPAAAGVEANGPMPAPMARRDRKSVV